MNAFGDMTCNVITLVWWLRNYGHNSAGLIVRRGGPANKR